MGIGDIRFGCFGHSLLRATLAAAIVASLSIPAAPAQSVTAPETLSSFEIPAGDLAVALDRFSTQTGMQVAYSPELVAGKRVAALTGRMTWRDALGKLLQDSGLEYQQVNGTTLVIRRAAKRASSPAARSSATTTPAASATAREESQVTDLDNIAVTGTRIRGGVTPSPVITIGSEQIAEEGFSDLGDVIRSIPQNFGGGQNPGVTAGATAGGSNNQNITGGSAVDLRGLGADATLTLLNGRRMSYGGYTQMVDISAIPVEAVERIEVVPDGASAIYGSDAVGGVANVILKRDFDGGTVGTRYGGATDGGLTTHEYTATGGGTWATGGLIATWKKASNDPIYSNQRSYTKDMYDPSTLYQGSDLRSGLISLHQSLGDQIELHLDALSTTRSKRTYAGYQSLYYRDFPETKTSLIAPILDFRLPYDWTLAINGAFGKDKTDDHSQTITSATGAISENYIGLYSNKSITYGVDAEGRLFALPGGDARLAFGAGYRKNHFLYMSKSGNRTYVDDGEGNRFAYVELSLPMIGSEQGIRGVERLELTGALRTEDYDSYGRVTNPKVGLVYSPSADFTLKTSWGKSFKTPTLLQRYYPQNALLYSATTVGGTSYSDDATVLYIYGGNEDLRPERARTWSASLAFHPEALPGLEAELTWFDIDYHDRIMQSITNFNQALSDPYYAEFIDYSPAAEEQADFIANSNFYNYTGTSYDPSNVVAIINGRYLNVARQQIKGIDLSGAYRFDLGLGRMTVRGSVSWLGSEQATTSTSGYSDMAGTLFFPVKVGSRVGVVWNKGGFTASVFGNYKSGVKNTTDDTEGASFTTFDTTLRYETAVGKSMFSEMRFEVAAQNLFNRAPPLYAATSLAYAPYDSTNYSAIGRFLSVSVSKHW